MTIISLLYYVLLISLIQLNNKFNGRIQCSFSLIERSLSIWVPLFNQNLISNQVQFGLLAFITIIYIMNHKFNGRIQTLFSFMRYVSLSANVQWKIWFRICLLFELFAFMMLISNFFSSSYFYFLCHQQEFISKSWMSVFIMDH